MNPAAKSSLPAISGVAVAVLIDYLPAHRRWGWLRLVQGSSALKDVPGLLFGKVMGSGNKGGFTLRPSGTHQGVIALFKQAEHALAFLNGPLVAAYRERAASCWSGLMSVESARGAWDGQAWDRSPLLSPLPELVSDQPQPQLLAALTRASIRPAKAMSFWKQAPATEADLRRSPGSVWPATAAMVACATTGAPRRAAGQAYSRGYFSESMFVRMRVIKSEGHWPGPLESSPESTHA